MSENSPQEPEVSQELRQEIDEAMAPAEDQAAQQPVEGELQTGDDGRAAELEGLVAERTADLQRLQAEYVNYKRRVDRDRQLARSAGAEAVAADLMPVLDSIQMAAGHDELTGGFKLVADELARVAAKHGLVAFGEVGEPFDPHLHEALMQVPLPGATQTCVSQVMQQGYRMNDRVLRPARVAVSDPDPTAGQNN
ncbi:nucleotide exchange factor GrpE [Luteococcus peritonei]|uniref:Protein GrpE n=1 Tax=Luteococcus peritonei TaxID=88874 RepID=A0ABW4RSN1_9ACTN